MYEYGLDSDVPWLEIHEIRGFAQDELSCVVRVNGGTVSIGGAFVVATFAAGRQVPVHLKVKEIWRTATLKVDFIDFAHGGLLVLEGVGAHLLESGMLLAGESGLEQFGGSA
ncbi:hypothetical protein AB0K15_21180 [Amycolatopsis sp. NPDC049253]|uniref:hypothetical protein n=1 Tax=Amycolatopsis sp. NPDC049253 TaxID=3155274 RepID=UPI00341DC2F8